MKDMKNGKNPFFLYTRREVLQKSGLGFGGLALASLLGNDRWLRASPMSDSPPPVFSDLRSRNGHFPGQAKAVIQLMQSGGPSQMDLFDPKPELTKRAGEPLPGGVEIHQPDNHNVLLASPFQFKRYGQSGMELSEVLPNLSTVVDELCMVRSLYTEHHNHPEGVTMLQTG